MSTTTPTLSAGLFRPASLKDFNAYAKHLAQMTGQGYLQARETLACVYGYANAHELQAVMAKQGKPGPFQDQEAIPEDIATARTTRTRAIVRARLDQLGLPGGKDPAFDQKLEALALFSSPVHHRRIFRIVEQMLGTLPEGAAQEVALAELERQAPPRKALRQQRFDELYAERLTFPKKALATFMLASRADDVSGRPSFDPREHTKKLYDYRRPAFYLLTTEPVPEHPDLPNWDDYFHEGPPAFPGNIEEFRGAWACHVFETLLPKYTGDDVSNRLVSALGDAEYAEVSVFLTAPSDEVSKTNPILSKIPTIVEVARLWEPYRLQQFATECVEGASPYVVLQDGAHAPEFCRGKFQGQQFAWSIAFKAGIGLGYNEMDDMSIWEYSATFMLCDQGGGRARPIALMSGTHIVPFKWEYAVSADGFAENMDDYSDYLNKVWKELKFQWFREQGYDSVEDFTEENPDGAFTTVEMEIIPELRGMGLAPRLLNWFRETVQAYPTSMRDGGWDVVGTENEADDTFLEDREFDLGTPAVFIIPVTGTRPQGLGHHVKRVDLAHSPGKVHIEHQNQEDELRKEKLTAHFLAMQQTVDADIVVFDPYEYPNT